MLGHSAVDRLSDGLCRSDDFEAVTAVNLTGFFHITQRAIRQVPREHLGMKYPGRDRTVHQLGFHVFRVAASYADTRELGNLDGAWFEENAPPEMADGDAVEVDCSGGDGVVRQVGQIAANIRSLKKPDPYKNKGIRYAGEVLRKKVGKTGAK